MSKILIIEDEVAIADLEKDYLELSDFKVDICNTGDEGLKTALAGDYDLIILDLMLPGGSGLDILRDIKRRNNPAGVIIVSAKDSLDDKVKGLEIGADDYLPKPFHLAELGMRVYAIIRRKEFGASNTLENNGIKINLLEKSVEANGRPVTLTKSEYDLLLFFIGNRNRVLSKGAIAEHLSGDFADMMDNFDFVYTHIKNLKAKLAQTGMPNCIQNVYGMGYKWIEL